MLTLKLKTTRNKGEEKMARAVMGKVGNRFALGKVVRRWPANNAENKGMQKAGEMLANKAVRENRQTRRPKSLASRR